MALIRGNTMEKVFFLSIYSLVGMALHGRFWNTVGTEMNSFINSHNMVHKVLVIYIMGDFNLDLSNIEDHQTAQTLTYIKQISYSRISENLWVTGKQHGEKREGEQTRTREWMSSYAPNISSEATHGLPCKSCHLWIMTGYG